MTFQQAPAELGLRALLVEADGTTRPVVLPADLPTGHAFRTAMAEHLGGPSFLGYCCPTCAPDRHSVTVGLLEHPPADAGHNEVATVITEMLRHAPLTAPIHGPALFLGAADEDDRPTGLNSSQQQAMELFAVTWLALLA
ncbi:hypothetical protein [Kitasatospora cineracea]|uniref:hypothetical protein n=1 Tax=Kitasatospora cineracea TaxID=88074 RepID=UPI0036B1693F